jgi:hypothetical protein
LARKNGSSLRVARLGILSLVSSLALRKLAHSFFALLLLFFCRLDGLLLTRHAILTA